MKTIISTILLSLGFLNLNAQIYAQPGASGTGMSPDSPIDLQSALDMASQGVSSAIWLTEGVYTNTPYVLDMTASDLEYVTITGSFNPDYTDLSYDPLSTAIDAGFGARALDIIATNTLSTQLGIEINDLTIRNGITNDENGAGIRADGGDPDTDGTLLSLNVTNVHFYDNVCSGSGSGGALWTNANPSFWDCAFDGNEGSNGGALFIANQGDGTQNGGGIYSCTFSNNLNFGNQGSTLWTNRYDFDITNSNFYGMDGGASSGNGSCIWGNTGSYLKIYTCRFEGIRINYWGSAVQNWDSDIDIVNCLFKDNKSGINNGYGSYAYYHNNGPDRDINIAQCTFVGNEGQNNVAWGAVQYRGNGADQLTVVNSLFWDNGNTPVVAEFGSASMSNCVTEFNPSGFSSTLDLVTTDPGLVNGYQFDETSVCVDAADELLNYIEDFSGLGRDVDGSPRNLSFQEPLTLDIGAYEFNAPPTGIGLVVFFPLEEGHSVPLTAGQLEGLGQLGDEHTFELVTGDGVNDADNDDFSIEEGTSLLKRNQFSNYETQSEYHIYIRATDSQGEFIDQELILEVIDVNEQPTLNIPLPDQSGVVGEFLDIVFDPATFLDPDLNDMFTYSAELVGGGPLPSWLTFDDIDFNFYGTPDAPQVLEIQVTATDLGGLTVSDTFTLTILPVGILELNEAGVHLYPNPVEDVLFVDGVIGQNAVLELIDATGRIIMSQQVNDIRTAIDISGMNNGVYSVSLLIEEKRYVSSLVKQ